MRLREYMELHRLNPRQFAEKVGDISRTAVVYWMDGDRMPDVPHIERIMNITGGQVTLYDLYMTRLEVLRGKNFTRRARPPRPRVIRRKSA